MEPNIIYLLHSSSMALSHKVLLCTTPFSCTLEKHYGNIAKNKGILAVTRSVHKDQTPGIFPSHLTEKCIA